MLSIISLAEVIHFQCIEYLEPNDQNSYALVNKFFVNNFLPRTRQLRIWDFSGVKITRNDVESLKDPYRQLIVNTTKFEIIRDLFVSSLTCKILGTNLEFFDANFTSGKITLNKVHRLDLSGGFGSDGAKLASSFTFLSIRNSDLRQGLGLKHVTVRMTDINELPLVPNLESLSIESLYALKSVSNYGYLQKLRLNVCHGITDVSVLSHVYDLEIVNCSGLRDISGLTHNYRVKIISCQNVTDFTRCFRCSREITVQGHINLIKINLKNYENCKQFSGKLIGGLLSEDIIPDHIRCISLDFISFGSFIFHVQQNQLDLSKLSKLSLTGGLLDKRESLVEFGEKIGDIACVELAGFSFLTDISLLGRGNQCVTLTKCDSLFDLRPLQYVPKVIVNWCPVFADLSHLSHVQDLTLDSCTEVMSLEALTHVQRLTLAHRSAGVSKLMNLKGCEYIPFIDVWHLSGANVESFQYFMNNQKVIVPAHWVDKRIEGIELMSINFLPPSKIPHISGSAYAFIRK